MKLILFSNLKVIYSIFFTLCAIIGVLSLANKDYDFGALCIAIALAPLVIIALFKDTHIVEPVKSKQRTKNSTKKDKKISTTYKSRRNKLDNKPRRVVSKAKSKTTRNNKNKNNSDNFYDITDAWNSI